MCGIVGVLNDSSGALPTEALLRSMLGMVRHRGPDEFGIYLADGVGLGNARLSIVDLEGGQQPICNEDQSLWIVFNGEIFNHVELRLDLESRGHRFATNTDTEVVLHLFEEFGPQCLSRLNGQFAIAIYNERNRALFLARDRLGVRPLFYTCKGTRLIFGSEIKAIFAHPDTTAEIDPVALEQVFTYWSPLSPNSSFRNVLSLPPGHYLEAQDGKIKVSRYWQMQFPDGDERADIKRNASGSDYVEQFRELLVDATMKRLRSDVPVGAYLSGGLDSSAIAAIIRKYGPGHLDTFSIAFSDPKYDESDHQLRMAEFLGTEHQVVFASHSEIGRVFPEVIWHTEAPIMRTSPAPMFLLSKLVNDRNYKVVLTGEGADEFLGGYDIFKEASIRRFWARQPNSAWRSNLLRRLYPDIGGLGGTGRAYLKAFFGAGLEETERLDYSHFIRWKNNRRTCRFFSKDVRAAIDRERGVENAVTESLPKEMKNWGKLEQAQFLEISIFLSQYLLSSQGDRPAMAHSVEGRYPFLDHRVVEFCAKLPSRLKLNGLTEKHLLRKVAQDWLPPEILARVKRPYRAPIHRSFFNDSPAEYVREVLDPSAILSAGLFNPSAVSGLVAKIDVRNSLSETDEMALCGIISTQLLHNQFVASFDRQPALDDADDVKVCDRRRVNASPDSA